MKAWKLLLGSILVCVFPLGEGMAAHATTLPVLSKPTPLYFSLTGFKWNRPIFQTGGNTAISYFIDESDFTADGGLSNAQVKGALVNAFNTWDGVASADLAFTQRPDDGGNYDLWDNSWAGAGTPDLGATLFYANVILGGWLPQSFFDDLGGGTSILGVTWIFGFVPGPGDPVGPNGLLDADGDGYDDFAMAEIYFNDYFAWNVDGSDIDIETVALHEIGHALGLDHSADPLSVMYYAYGGVRRDATADDVAGISTLYPLAAPIPEPSTVLLLGAGLVGVGVWARKWKKTGG